MEHVESWLRTFMTVFEVAVQHDLAYSVLVGWTVAIGGEIWLLMAPWSTSNLWKIRMATLPIGFAVTYSLWPISDYFSAVKICTALMVGVTAPMIKFLMVAVIGIVWPSMAEKMRAAPAKP